MAPLTHNQRFLPGLLLLLPFSASASGPPPGIMFFIYGVMPLLLCLTIFSIYLLFSRFSWIQRFTLLGLFVALAAVIGVITYLPGESAHKYSFMMWLGPPFVVGAFARQMPRKKPL